MMRENALTNEEVDTFAVRTGAELSTQTVGV